MYHGETNSFTLRSDTFTLNIMQNLSRNSADLLDGDGEEADSREEEARHRRPHVQGDSREEGPRARW